MNHTSIDTSDIPAQGEEFFAQATWRLSNPAASAVIILEPDVAAAFPDAAAVNKALRSVMQADETNRAAPAAL